MLKIFNNLPKLLKYFQVTGELLHCSNRVSSIFHLNWIWLFNAANVVIIPSCSASFMNFYLHNILTLIEQELLFLNVQEYPNKYDIPFENIIEI